MKKRRGIHPEVISAMILVEVEETAEAFGADAEKAHAVQAV